MRSIEEVVRQAPSHWNVKIFAVDDGSTDGTGEALRSIGPRVEVIHGSGQLFWAGGMRLASRHATTWGADWYMWINDDVVLASDALSSFTAIADGSPSQDPRVIVGEIVDPATLKLTYGARSWSSRTPLAFPFAANSDSTITTFNGNLVFFSEKAYTQVGGFPDHYHHGFADFIIGLRASRAGIGIERLATTGGFDTLNPTTNRLFDPQVSLPKRLRIAFSPFGLPPIDYLRFCAEVNGTSLGVWWFLRSYLRVLRVGRRTD